jgi:predicted glutamine amidotransferase
MCGIFGVIASADAQLKKEDVKKLVLKLFLLSESRGKESAGMAIHHVKDNTISVLKHSVAAGELIKTQEFQDFFENNLASSFTNGILSAPLAIMAHARLVTNGSQENNNNNQPVIHGECVAVHNGIITNVDELWTANPHMKRTLEVDTEVWLALLQQEMQTSNDWRASVSNAFAKMEGSVTSCVFHAASEQVLLCTNNASLYYSKAKGCLLFASENFILNTALEESGVMAAYNFTGSTWSEPYSAQVFSMKDGESKGFLLKEKGAEKVDFLRKRDLSRIDNLSPDKALDFSKVDETVNLLKHSPLRKMLEFNIDAIKKLKRCSKCLLPETFPFIRFDAKGECNYCGRYIVKNQGKREQEFKQMMEKYRSRDGKPDCIIPFSGGRDSSYGLHYIVHELKLHPITYTYDWGMVTDLARRNIARVCGKLGIENIIVSADLPMKRENIRKNVEAWLKQPSLGIIPLFMAGDKQFFYFVNQVKKQTGIPLDIWSTNSLETTDFKVGFCGVRPTFDKTRPDYLPLKSKIALMSYYGMQFLKNPAYLNSSIKDTLHSFWSYYAEPRTNFYQLFDWIKWDEKQIESTLLNEYNWELSPDTTTSWRIGDGTAPFYNYIYYTVAGFSEFDTFRSNQIREGLITREEGLAKIYDENRPRFESMHWYLDVIGVDFEKAIKVVNKIPKLYPL